MASTDQISDASAMASYSASRSWAQMLQDGDGPHLSPKRLMDQLRLDQKKAAVLVRVHRNHLSRQPAAPKVQEGLRDVVKILTAATDLFGDPRRASHWFINEPIADYRYKTAADLLSEGQVDAIIAWLEDLEAGATG